MSPQSNATWKTIAISVATAVIIFLVMAVLGDQSRISVLETQMTAIERTLETNRVENNRAHEQIGQQLTELLKELAKK